MKVKTFNSIEDVHKIWNDETWIRYNEIKSALPSGVYLTKEQEEQLFPSMPDYIVIDDTVYKPDVSEHLERCYGKVDGSSFYRVELVKVTDPEITDPIINTPEKRLEQLRERLEKNHPKLAKLGLHIELQRGFSDRIEIKLVRTDGKIVASQSDYTSTEAELEKWLCEVDSVFEFINQLNQLLNEESISITNIPHGNFHYWEVKGVYHYNHYDYSFGLSKYENHTQLYIHHTINESDLVYVNMTDHLAIKFTSYKPITVNIENTQNISLDIPVIDTMRKMIEELEPYQEMIL